jgi:hypothetical protein
MMKLPSPPPRKPLASTRRHRRESFWQIVFPVIFVSAVVIGLITALFVVGGAARTSIVADYALILTMLPWLVVGLLIFVVFAALIYGIARLTKAIPPYTNEAQYIMQQVAFYVSMAMDRVTGFFIGVAAAINGIANFVQKQAVNLNGSEDGKSGTSNEGV